MPRVSIIIAAYNAEPYIRDAVASMLAQTFGDFELVVINDGSKDRTGAILDKIAAADTRVRIIHQQNQGLVRSLQNGIAATTAPLIARMDADDLSTPRRLELQVAYMDAHPDVVLCGGDFTLIDEHGRTLTTIRQQTDDAWLQSRMLEGTTSVCHPLAIFRRDAYERAGGYRELVPAEDIDLWLRMGEVGKLGGVSEVLLMYRQHANSISESQQARQIEMIRKVVEDAWDRRGVRGQYEYKRAGAWRSMGDRESKLRQLLKYGWWAFNSGHADTARSYGWSAVRCKPTSGDAWKLFVCGCVKRPPKGSHAA